ncbi:hypothetical protein M0811_13517 [Anaeramoeba ignava]|uniref:Uncharacterized protein n=1 Tax=Anaeramoeba ignava TaxID=1746090 RepID=A0A9Q0L692_ANAIG|nr:hypothetical protein M0811_13517 [Anaeramoeba ignava]
MIQEIINQLHQINNLQFNFQIKNIKSIYQHVIQMEDGYISSISLITDNFAIAPIIYETISKIEEIEFNFTKLTNANNYSISLNNGTNWQKFIS